VQESIAVSTITKVEVKLKKHKLIWNTVQDFANSGVVKEASGSTQIWAKALRAHQHTLQSFQITNFLSKYLDQNMLLNAAIFGKSWKIAVALGALPPTPLSLWRLGLCPQIPELLFPLNGRVNFSLCLAFLYTVKIKIRLIISYLSDS